MSCDSRAPGKGAWREGPLRSLSVERRAGSSGQTGKGRGHPRSCPTLSLLYSLPALRKDSSLGGGTQKSCPSLSPTLLAVLPALLGEAEALSLSGQPAGCPDSPLASPGPGFLGLSHHMPTETDSPPPQVPGVGVTEMGRTAWAFEMFPDNEMGVRWHSGGSACEGLGGGRQKARVFRKGLLGKRRPLKMEISTEGIRK